MSAFAAVPEEGGMLQFRGTQQVVGQPALTPVENDA
jgi:hypothetical protein